MGPLKGVRVVEIGGLIAGPLAARMFGDFGAEVVKIEEPRHGDELRDWGAPSKDGPSFWFLSQARNKRLVAMDVKHPEGRRLARELLARADILVENLRPGKLEQLGLGPEEVWPGNRKLIYVRISGFGQTGPYSRRAGYGSIAEAMGGVRYVTGFPDRPPVRTGFSLGDSLVALHAVAGGLAALHHQRLTGEGQVVDASITEAVLNVTDSMIPDYVATGAVRERNGNALLAAAPSNIYPTADGEWMAIGGNGDHVFVRLMRLIGRDDLAEDEELASNRLRVARAAELDEAIAAWTASRRRVEIQKLLDEAGVPAGPIYSARGIVEDEQMRDRGMIVRRRTPGGEETGMTGIVPRFSATEAEISQMGGALGRDTREVLASWLGVDEAAIRELHRQGVIRCDGM